jgi:hypothetical protein
VPESVHVPTGHPGGEDRQRGGPALPGLREDRFIGPGRTRGAPSRGAPHVSDALHDATPQIAA